MDTSSYGQGGMAGGVLVFPDYWTVPNGIVIGEEQVNITATDIPTVYLTGSVNAQVTGVFVNGINQNFPKS